MTETDKTALIFQLKDGQKLGYAEFGDSNSYKHNHSKRDTIDRIDCVLLKKLCQTI